MAPAKRPGAASKTTTKTAAKPVSSLPGDGSGFLPESKVLRKANASLTDADWPVFDLRNVVVMDITRTHARNLLRVGDLGPFFVRGRLYCDMSDKTQTKQLLRPKDFRPLDIEILASSMSIGLDNLDTGDDTEEISGPVIWAKSYYGFFRIASATPSYSPMLNYTLAGITLYYSIMGVYEEHALRQGSVRNKATGKVQVSDLPLDDVLLQYVVMIGDGSVREEVYERCLTHAIFLASHFQFESTFNWDPTSFARYIKSILPTAHEWERKNINIMPSSSGRFPGIDFAPPPLARQGLPSKSRINSPAVSVASVKDPVVEAKALDRKTRSRALGRTTRSSSAATNIRQWEKDMVTRPHPDNIKAAPAQEPEPEPKPEPEPEPEPETETELTASANENTPARIVFGFLPDFLESRTNQPGLKSLNGYIWQDLSTHSWRDAQAITAYIARDLFSLMDADLERREFWQSTKLWRDLQEAPAFKESLQPSSIERMVKQLRKRKRLAKSATATAGQKRPYEETRPLTGGKTSSLRPTKRAAVSVDIIPTKKGVYPTRSSVPRDSSDDVVIHDVEDDEDDELAMSRPKEPKAALKAAHGDDDEFDSERDEAPPVDNPITLVIRSEPLPSAKPNEPNGVWVCRVPGCPVTEEAAEYEDGEERILEHIKAHERMALAKTAESRGHAISHLLEKIKAFNDDTAHKDDRGTPSAPKPPVKRRFFGLV